MRDEAALVPALDPLMPEDVADTVQSQQEPLEAQDLELATLSSVPGFQRIMKKMQQDIDDLRTGKAVKIDGSFSMAQVGERYAVASGVANKLQGYLDLVTNAQNAVSAREEAANAARQGTA